LISSMSGPTFFKGFLGVDVGGAVLRLRLLQRVVQPRQVAPPDAFASGPFALGDPGPHLRTGPETTVRRFAGESLLQLRDVLVAQLWRPTAVLRAAIFQAEQRLLVVALDLHPNPSALATQRLADPLQLPAHAHEADGIDPRPQVRVEACAGSLFKLAGTEVRGESKRVGHGPP
jgi:hypothetical protein